MRMHILVLTEQGRAREEWMVLVEMLLLEGRIEGVQAPARLLMKMMRRCVLAVVGCALVLALGLFLCDGLIVGCAQGGVGEDLKGAGDFFEVLFALELAFGQGAVWMPSECLATVGLADRSGVVCLGWVEAEDSVWIVSGSRGHACLWVLQEPLWLLYCTGCFLRTEVRLRA